MGPRKGATAAELLRELGSVLRLSEAEAAALADEAPDADEQTMILNMGPQHPSTHGVLRLMLELEGETVLRTKPIIGYLHTGMEKTGETLTYLQGATNTTRMDYAAPLFNELVFSPRHRDAARHRRATSRRGRSGSACCCASSTACRRTCCSSPPTAWTSARCR